MKLSRIIAAYNVLESMADHLYDFKVAYQLYTLKKEMVPHVQFYAAEELKMVEKYAEKNENGKAVIQPNGKFNFMSAEAKEGFLADNEALGNVTAEWNREVLKLPVAPMMSMKQLEALDGFIEFGAEEK